MATSENLDRAVELTLRIAQLTDDLRYVRSLRRNTYGELVGSGMSALGVAKELRARLIAEGVDVDGRKRELGIADDTILREAKAWAETLDTERLKH